MNDNLIWINACEASADIYGARLMQELERRRPGLEIMGMGGQSMRSLGLKTVFRSEELSLVGLTEVFTAIPRIMGYLREIRQLMREKRPAAVVLMDAPDFNFRLAKMAHSLGIPVLYYIAPQVWAWRRSRVKFLQKHVDRIACIFPFEETFFREQGIKADFVGHPFMETLDSSESGEKKNENFIAVLPGSRKKEISSLLPVFSRSADILHQTYPDMVFNIIQAPGIQMDFLKKFCPQRPWIRFVSFKDRYACIRKCTMALAASGTVTLECAVLGVPAVVAYRLSWISYLAGRMLIHVRHISMPNLILDREIFPELIQERASAKGIVSTVRNWLDNPQQLSKVREYLKEVKDLLGEKPATDNCAELVLELMKKGKIYGKS